MENNNPLLTDSFELAPNAIILVGEQKQVAIPQEAFLKSEVLTNMTSHFPSTFLDGYQVIDLRTSYNFNFLLCKQFSKTFWQFLRLFRFHCAQRETYKKYAKKFIIHKIIPLDLPINFYLK